MKRYLLSLLLFFALFTSLAQVRVTGKIVQETGEPLPGATIRVLSKDSTFLNGTVSGDDGTFTLTLAPNTRYNLLFTYFSYRGKGSIRPLFTKEEPISLGSIVLKEAANLKEVVVEGVQTRGEQKGDTTSFNAGAYKTNPDANAEDLVKKLPGVTQENGSVKVNGETVQKVLVDGKPFFGDDPTTAMKNLPADMVEKVEVYDKMSDQSQFTGISDRDPQKTINFVTKKDRNKGSFGKVYAGGGADENPVFRYNAGANINYFNAKRRITLLYMSNNVNQQNFASSDISGAMSSRGGGRMGGGMFSSGPTGNTTTHSGGLNYNDEWGKKIVVAGSYFYNRSINTMSSTIARSYFTENAQKYNQVSQDRNDNENHRMNFRFEYTIDSANKLTLTPALTIQNNSGTTLLDALNTINSGKNLSKTSTSSKNTVNAYDFSNTILLQHRFKKNKRTLSFSVSNTLSERINPGLYNSNTLYFDTISTVLNQEYMLYSYNKKYSAQVAWTEPLTNNAYLQISYNPSYNVNKSDKTTRDFNSTASDYSDFNTSLSNKYDNTYIAQRGGITYKYAKDKASLEAGADVQDATLAGKQTFPTTFSINQHFTNVLPNAMYNYKYSRTRNFRVYYRSSTNIPSTSQLQNVADISNPIQVRAGNPALKQSFDQNLNIRYGGFDPATSKNFMLFLNGSVSNNYITNGTYILSNDSTIFNALVRAGSQVSLPVNLNGYYSGRAYATYGFPLKKLKSNLSFSGGLNHSNTPSIINNLRNASKTYAAFGGLNLGSNISQNLDFSLRYNASYTAVKNSVQASANNNYFTHTAGFQLNWIFLKGIVLNTDLSHTMYNGLTQSFNQSYFIWNGSLGYKFLKAKNLEVKASVFDLLNQNRSISRTINSSYLEDNITQVLRRYFLLTLTYNFKKYTGKAPEPAEGEQRGPGGRGRPEGPGPGGPPPR